jgi:hypothetical protein
LVSVSSMYRRLLQLVKLKLTSTEARKRYLLIYHGQFENAMALSPSLQKDIDLRLQEAEANRWVVEA